MRKCSFWVASGAPISLHPTGTACSCSTVVVDLAPAEANRLLAIKVSLILTVACRVRKEERTQGIVTREDLRVLRIPWRQTMRCRTCRAERVYTRTLHLPSLIVANKLGAHLHEEGAITPATRLFHVSYAYACSLRGCTRSALACSSSSKHEYVMSMCCGLRAHSATRTVLRSQNFLKHLTICELKVMICRVQQALG
jgi:hypothetical protein